MNRWVLWFCVLFFLILCSPHVPAGEPPTGDDVVATLVELRDQDTTYSRLFDHFGDPRELYDAFVIGKKEAEQDWQRSQRELVKINDFGSTKTLEILPLIDWNVANDGLAGEPGVAYLVRTDHATILFDVGLNAKGEDPSPLVRNMRKLDVEAGEIDSIVISHPHPDHTGGPKQRAGESFSLAGLQIDPEKVKAYSPSPMEYPGIEVAFADDPVVIAPGVATTGVITNYFFFMGKTPEQALAINVEGQGIVVIVGCGHQGLRKIVDRTEALFDDPLVGIVGGLHYPVTEGRNIGIHRYVGTGKLPGEFLTIEEVQANVDYLKAREIAIVGLSPHDSCDTSIEIFKESFPEAYREIVVGEKIVM